MARHSELIGQPDRIKQILCDSATDLGREQYFQGAGMLDILRALGVDYAQGYANGRPEPLAARV